MLKVLQNTKNGSSLRVFTTRIPLSNTRSLSVQSAISKGIRRGHGGRVTNGSHEAGANPTKIRRPNISQQWDTEDFGAGERSKKARRSEKLDNYLRGGPRRVEQRIPRGPTSFPSSQRPLSDTRYGERRQYEPQTRPSENSPRLSHGSTPRQGWSSSRGRGESRPERGRPFGNTSLQERSSIRSQGGRQSDGGEGFRDAPKKEWLSTQNRGEFKPEGGGRLGDNFRNEKTTRWQSKRDEEEDEDIDHDSSSSYQRDDHLSSGGRRTTPKPIGPLTIPHTTPASEFLYGTSVITAALRSSRRKLYKLYMYDGANREVQAQDAGIKKLAMARGVNITLLKREWLRLMDKMSQGRPHNGYVLEASPLPKQPATGLQVFEAGQSRFSVNLDHQSREDEIVNGTDPSIELSTNAQRYPFVLLLDSILDPGNLGGILRSAYFLGVDAVAISSRNSAPLTPVTLKSSAGACENLPLLSINHPGAFIDESKGNGWKFYAAVTSGSNAFGDNHFSTSNIGYPVKDHPCILMLGGEGEGLRRNLVKKADALVSIEGHRGGQGGVDSLNVSVAAGLLCDAFLRNPTSTTTDPNLEAPVKEIPIVKERLF